MIFPCYLFTDDDAWKFDMPWLAVVTGENRTMTRNEIRHTLFSAFSESLFAKSHLLTSFNSLVTI